MRGKISSVGKKPAQNNAQSTCQYGVPIFLERNRVTSYRGTVASPAQPE